MIKPVIRTAHSIWRQPAWQLLLIIIALSAVMFWAYFRIASVAGAGETFGDTAEERLVVLGAGAAAVIAMWGVVGQWSISSRQLTIQYLRQIETDGDFIRALELFNAAVADGDMEKYAHGFKRPSNWKKMSRKERKKLKKRFETTDHAIILVLNTDEMVAIGVKSAILDYRLVCTYRRKITINRWNAAKRYVDAQRTASGPHTLWIELERLARRMEDDPYHMIL